MGIEHDWVKSSKVNIINIVEKLSKICIHLKSAIYFTDVKSFSIMLVHWFWYMDVCSLCDNMKLAIWCSIFVEAIKNRNIVCRFFITMPKYHHPQLKKNNVDPNISRKITLAFFFWCRKLFYKIMCRSCYFLLMSFAAIVICHLGPM